MKTAGRENPKRWVTTSQQSSPWCRRSEQISFIHMCCEARKLPASGEIFFLTSAFIELLSSYLAAGIRRVKGVRRLGVRVGNWLTAEEGKKLLGTETAETLRSQRNRALLSLLIGCDLRKAEVTTLRCEDLQLREGHWVIADLRGRGGHIRRFPFQNG